jgi:predicted membrane chloride channel (bestrophin family)
MQYLGLLGLCFPCSVPVLGGRPTNSYSGKPLALDRIGRNLEDPFDNRVYDVPLLAITKNIEANLLQMLGDKELPAPEEPQNGILW